LKLTDRQQVANEVLASGARHIMLEGGSRSGKTFLAVRAICIRAMMAKRSRHAALRFRFKHAKEAIGMDTLPAVMRLCFPQVPYQLNKSDWFAVLPNESEIWLGGLDEKERAENIFGKEFATIYLNECSQIPFASRNLAITRLAQKCEKVVDGIVAPLALKAYYDCNPPAKTHWTYQLFHGLKNPDSQRALEHPGDYAHVKLNPADNRENLAPEYLAELESLPERLRKRFLLGEYGDALAGALWTDDSIDCYRVAGAELPQMVRIVIAVDPSGSGDEDNAGNDEIGIVVAGLGIDGNGYVLEDITCKAGPKVWGNLAVTAYDRHQADVIVAETNYGGEMVRFVIETARKGVPFRKLTASRGKAVRAEPIAALTEQGKVRFAGRFAKLEDELCAFTTNGYMGSASPNRADAFIWAMSELFPGMTQDRAKDKPLPLVATGIV
jgi:phage terminase large subunit-like protein